MPTSSISKNFVVEEKDAELFAKVVDESYQESLIIKREPYVSARYIDSPEELSSFIRKSMHS